MPFLSSCNIACSGHVGDEDSIRNTIILAKAHKIAIGAHPSYPDKKNFGRLTMQLDRKALIESLDEQIDLFLEISKNLNTTMHHIKPHGALYNDMAKDNELSRNILSHWRERYGNILTYLLADSVAHKTSNNLGISSWGEAFVDRAYEAKTKLVSRKETDAIISNKAELTKKLAAFCQSKLLDKHGITHTATIDTICLHGDHKHADNTARFVHQFMGYNNVKISAHR